MKLHRINAVIVRHVYESRRNFDRVVDMIWWPVLDIVMWGFFTVYLAHSNRLQPNVVSCLLGGIILWGTFYSFQRDMAIGFIDELWCRNLINLFSTPLTLAEYMAGTSDGVHDEGDGRTDWRHRRSHGRRTHSTSSRGCRSSFRTWRTCCSLRSRSE